MIRNISVFCGFMLLLGGCASSKMPRLVGNPGSDEPWNIAPKADEPASEPVESEPEPQPVPNNVPPDWLPPSRVEKRWTAIVIHHSATETGNAAIFDRTHREEKHWDGVGYDFVIGNGTNSDDGQVEVTFRWRQQVAGAHCGGTEDNWANVDAVGICLVGNFNNTEPTDNQMQSLLKLVRFLRKRYGIRTASIYGHSSTPGARVTDCPGRNSPVPKLKLMLGS
jgi:N-acetyl-anhydromuramyl-L-alanine amidase AmpD